MNILQVTPGYPPTLGGVEQHVHDISVALSRLGHRVTIASADGADLPAQEEREGVVVRRFASVGHGVYRAPLGLAAFLRREAGAFDVVHAHNIHALPLLAAAQVCGGRTVVTPHYHGHGHSRFATLLHTFYTPVARAALHHVAGVVCVSASEGALVAERLGVPARDIAVVPNIVEPPALGLGAEAEDAGQAGRVLLSVGRLEAYKRIDRAVAALAHLPADVRLVVVGVGPARPALEQQARSLGVIERVAFVGRVSDAELARWYRRAHTVVSFSEAEAFGRTVVEALSYGCRVVGNTLPAYREFAASYPQAITLVPTAAGASGAASALCETLASTAPLHVDLTRFTGRSIAGQLVEIYEGVSAHSTGRSPSASRCSAGVHGTY
jgi:glycosyltransferase involved in cell wall biosynthesis